MTQKHNFIKAPVWALITLLSLLVIHPGCGNQGPEKTLQIGLPTFPHSLNPVYATKETATMVCNKIFDSLYYYNEKGELVPGLVTQETLNKKHNQWVINLHLKQGIHFSDGKEFNANDVTATLALLANDAFKYPYPSVTGFIGQVEKTGPYSVKLTLKKPSAAWKHYLVFKILNARDLENAEPARFNQTLLTGTGAYAFHKIEGKSKVWLKINRFHKQASTGNMHRFLCFSVITYSPLAPLKLVNGEMDICELQASSVRAYSENESWQKTFQILKYRKFGYTYLAFNLDKQKLTPNIRAHFYNVLMCSDFTGQFLAGRGERVPSPFLLLGSSFTPRRLRVEQVEPAVTLKIKTNGESSLRTNFIRFLQHRLEPLGIHLEQESLEYQSFMEKLKKGDYEIAVSGFMLDRDYDMSEIFHSKAYFNYWRFNNPEMDTLLEQGLLEEDARKREAIYGQAHHVWRQHLPMLPLFSLYYYVGVSRGIKVPDQTYEWVRSSGDFLFNIHRWTTVPRD